MFYLKSSTHLLINFCDSDTFIQKLLSAKYFLALTKNHYSAGYILRNFRYLLKYRIATVTFKALPPSHPSTKYPLGKIVGYLSL